MTPRSDPNHAAVQRAAWDSLWRLLLKAPSDAVACRESDSAPSGQLGASVGLEVKRGDDTRNLPT